MGLPGGLSKLMTSHCQSGGLSKVRVNKKGCGFNLKSVYSFITLPDIVLVTKVNKHFTQALEILKARDRISTRNSEDKVPLNVKQSVKIVQF